MYLVTLFNVDAANYFGSEKFQHTRGLNANNFISIRLERRAILYAISAIFG